MDTKRSAVVIGGGPAGLVAAARLAEAGLETTLLESRSSLGGRAATQQVEGFPLNQGPHALYLGGPAIQELKRMGIDPAGWNPTRPAGSVLIRGGRVRRSTGGTVALVRWLARVRREDPQALAHVSTTEWLDSRLTGPAREMAAALVRLTTFVGDHNSLSADVAAQQVSIGLYPGVRYIRGGWQQMVDRLAAAAASHGAVIRTGAAVRSLDRSAGGWRVETEDQTHEADAVVVAAGGPKAFAKLLGDRAPSAPGRPALASVLDLGFKRLPKRSRTFALGVDRPSYLSRHSPPTTGPDSAHRSAEELVGAD